ncbi:MAG: YheC/YheD family protein, partial [Bacillota bacterium]
RRYRSASSPAAACRLDSSPGATGGCPAIDLGPVVGILAAQYHNTYRLFVGMARRRGVLAYLFAPADVVWDERVVLGRSLHRGGWVRRPFPFPQVVFDRSIGIGPPETIAGFLEQLRAHGCTVFNGDLGDKWRMYQHLASYPQLRRHLPETVLLESWDTVRAMLSRWGVVYLKPAAGFMGLGVLRVAAAGPGVVRIASSANFGARVVPEAALAGQLGQWQAYGKWMVQQGLDLVRVGGRVCDVRVLALKDGRARWRVAGMTVRRARPGSVVSNLHRGGTVLPFQAFACRVPRRRGAAPLGVELRRLVKRILPAVDAIAPRAGDVGVDIGVDRDGRLWIIEVNTKPGRSGRLANPAVYSLPMEYARYLAGFGPASPARGVPPRPGTEGSGKESTALERIPEV